MLFQFFANINSQIHEVNTVLNQQFFVFFETKHGICCSFLSRYSCNFVYTILAFCYGVIHLLFSIKYFVYFYSTNLLYELGGKKESKITNKDLFINKWRLNTSCLLHSYQLLVQFISLTSRINSVASFMLYFHSSYPITSVNYL